MKSIFTVLILIIVSIKSISQPREVLKFDSWANFMEKSNKETKGSEYYNLLTVDFYRQRIEIYPDSIVLNFIGKLKQRMSKDMLITEFNCRDKYNDSCTVYLMVPLDKDKGSAMKLQWDTWYIIYFIGKQSQFPIKP